MKNYDFVLASGAKLHISPADFPDAIALNDARLQCLKGLNIGKEETLLDSSIAICSSADVREAFFRCAKKASYQDIRVTQDLFNDDKLGDQARGDYAEILKMVIEVNCRFFPLADSGSPRSETTKPESRLSK